MSIQNWIKSAYVTIGTPPFFRLEGFPSIKEGKPPRSDFPNAILTHQQDYFKLNLITPIYPTGFGHYFLLFL